MQLHCFRMSDRNQICRLIPGSTIDFYKPNLYKEKDLKQSFGLKELGQLNF